MAANLQKLIASNPVLVLSKTTCGYCQRAKALLAQKGVSPKIVELDVDPQGPSLQAAATSLTNHRTVPSIWINQQHVGGFDNISALDHAGKLDSMLARSKPATTST